MIVLTLFPFLFTLLASQLTRVSRGKYLAPQQFFLNNLFITSALISASVVSRLDIKFTYNTFRSQYLNTCLFNNNLVNMSEELYSKKEYESIIIKTLGDSPKLRIVDFFLDNPLFDFTKKEVIEALGMSKQTFYKYFPELEEYEIVKVSRRIGKAKLYKLNLEHPLVNMIREYEKKVSLQIAEKEAAKLKKPILAK